MKNNLYQGIRIAGFGGQGVISAGVLLAQAGIVEGKNVSWFPSYGPEMRGGTANCSVVISNKKVATPIVSIPETAIVMNEPSFAKFEPKIKEGGLLIVNKSLINSKSSRKDIKILEIDCNGIADGLGNLKIANMVALGAYSGASGAVSIESISEAMKKVFKRAKPEILELNKKALQVGVDAVKK